MNYALVHCKGQLTTTTKVEDQRFTVSLDNAVKIKREVQMLQWVETKEERSGDGFTCHYNPEWCSTVIDSTTFQEEGTHKNPNKLICKEEIFTNDQITLGNYLLAENQLLKLNKFEPVKIS